MRQIDGFGGYFHYISTRDQLEELAREGVFEKSEPNPFEVSYQCKQCQTLWVLAEPDFPVKGYLLRRKDT